MPKTISTIENNVGILVGDTSTNFLTKVRIFVNNRWRDSVMRLNGTMWSYASFGDISGATYFPIDYDDILELGATSDAFKIKKQFAKAASFTQSYEYALSTRVIAGDHNRFNISFSRYGYHSG